MSEKLRKKYECFQRARKDLEKTVKQEDYDSMTQKQREAMALAVNCALIGILDEVFAFEQVKEKTTT